MRLLILIFSCALLSQFDSYSQFVKQQLLDHIEADYIEIRCVQNGFKNEMIVEVDYGQRIRGWFDKDAVLTDSEGNNLIFNTKVGVLNYFSSLGYSYKDEILSGKVSEHDFHFLLQKKDSSMP
ncbi:hypothetical protein [Marinigracilibium pacificum]|uniref:Uncharacterized protein n=1 Tax=Marinigracilibium pacificum TaxID=2729599 RepID=A0A848J3C3_9BACT|nr:hypothetical protein [Marinigracilibium pacificum]NMM49828.1 hypothetical protein [Marinigracilibium pacificum]